MITPDRIRLLNRHWTSGAFATCNYRFRRNIYTKISTWLSQRQVISISGLRRTGKSVLVEQLRDSYIQAKHIRPQHYMYFSFEQEDLLDLYPTTELEAVLSYFFDTVLSLHPQELTEPVLICLDEIQNVRSWQSVIKTYYDLSPNIKFIVSGSSALYLHENSESLAGRIVDFPVFPLSFGEFLQLRGEHELRTIGSIEELLTFPAAQVTLKRQNLFDDFLCSGGFPETVSMLASGLSIEAIQEYLSKSIATKIISKDLLKYFKLKSTYNDLQLFKIICNETGSVHNFDRLSSDTNVAAETLKKHLEAFRASSLIHILKKFDPKLRKMMNSHPKIYVASPSLIMSYLGYSTIPKGSLVGHLVESYIFMRLYELIGSVSDELFYASVSRTKEVDFYLPRYRALIETKFGDSVNAEDLVFLQRSADKYKLKPILICKTSPPVLTPLSVPASYI